MPHSHHSHSGQFCKHAKGLLEDVVLEAIRQGFEVYGLTEHVPRYRTDDLYPDEAGLTLDDLAAQFESFLDEAHRLKAKYASEITLLVGLETEYITDLDLEHLDALLARHGTRIEYIVGSVHHVNGIPIDFDLPTFHKALRSCSSEGDTSSSTQEAFLRAYLDAQYALLQRFRPEIIGHFDLCRLYDPALAIPAYSAAWKKVERNVSYAVECGALFEVNAAAFRKGWEMAYPGKDVAELILKHGGRFALSDDSHGPHAVGLNYPRLHEYLRNLGVQEVWYLQRSDVPNAAGRMARLRELHLEFDSGFCVYPLSKCITYVRRRYSLPVFGVSHPLPLELTVQDLPPVPARLKDPAQCFSSSSMI
ncbi:putative histidinol phosphate phosphatase H [Lyophyllum shimeji]|uniref:Histidinol-phosphatase n=1 Tax=Lyophyllum shimeji TaxID=47721 RepID=A0A9P3UQZ2_LYOSH|nr:putative histidinol phosphate phosphatase H [Lyophyllum shimeji]